MLDLEYVPKGMTIADYRDHPVYRMLILAGTGGRKATPSKAEVESLGLDSVVRKRLMDASLRVARLRDDPDQAEGAMTEAEQSASDIISGLPDYQQDPRWFGRPDGDDLTQLSPAELADRVPRMW